MFACQAPPPRSIFLSTLTKSSSRHLPNVEEEPLEKELYQQIDDLSDDDEDSFGLCSCLCDDVCPRGNSSEDLFDGATVGELDIDGYDVGFLSDGDVNNNASYGQKRRAEGLNDHSIPPTLALPFGGTESVSNPFLTPIVTDHDKISIERDRAMATTPLLPPLMTGAIGKPPMVSSATQSPHLMSNQSFDPRYPLVHRSNRFAMF
ncbi:hypothetical protein ACQRIU_001294 [Beauveria bassiana]